MDSLDGGQEREWERKVESETARSFRLKATRGNEKIMHNKMKIVEWIYKKKD